MLVSDEDKRQIMSELAHGNPEALDQNPPDVSMGQQNFDVRDYQNFDDFAQRSSRDERRQLFGRSLHPDRIPSSQMEPELQKAIAQIKLNERDDVAREFFNHLKQRRLSDHDLEQQLGLSTHHPKQMTADDVSKLAAFTYHAHPDIFQDVLADQPTIMKFLSNPLVGAVLGAIAAKWFGGRK